MKETNLQTALSDRSTLNAVSWALLALLTALLAANLVSRLAGEPETVRIPTDTTVPITVD